MDQSSSNEDQGNDKVDVEVKNSNQQSKFYKKNIIKYGLIAALALLVIGVGLFFINDNYASNNESVTLACSDTSEGAVLFKAKQIFVDTEEAVTKEKIDPLVEEIKSIKNYNEDANCIYPIIYSYMLDANFASASAEYDDFARLYGDGSNFAKDIYPMQNIEDLKSLLDFSLKIQSDGTIIPTPNNVEGAGEQVSEIPESEIIR